MTAKDILKGQTCPKALQGAEFTFVVVEEAHALYEKVLVGEGMPSFDEPGKCGDLVIKYTVEFPATLNDQQRHLLKAALFLPTNLSSDQSEALKQMSKVFPFD